MRKFLSFTAVCLPLLVTAPMHVSANPGFDRLENLGTIQATLGGVGRELVTVYGELDGESGATALWALSDDPGYGPEVMIFIQGYDPERDELFSDDGLLIIPELITEDPQEWLAHLGEAIPAEIVYTVVSDDGQTRTEYSSRAAIPPSASVTFSALTYDEPAGKAMGTFSGEICQFDMDAAQRCLTLEGQFDTILRVEYD